MTYTMPEGYADVLASTDIRVEPLVSIGTNIDMTAADDVTAMEGTFLPMSNPAQVFDANYQVTEWMTTFEGDGIKTATGFGMLAPPITAVRYPPEVGLWSDVISGADGSIDWTITIRLSKVHRSALTIYTHGGNILEADATFRTGDTVTRTAELVPSAGRVMTTDAADFDSIVIHVRRIENPYHHVKIAEIVFGASIAYGSTSLSGVTSWVQEWDPVGISMPLYELDFALMNVFGEYDPDNPEELLSGIPVNYPVELALIISKDDVRYTVPCGRFQISERVASDVDLRVRAYDARVTFKDNMSQVTLKTDQSLGDFFTDLMADLRIPYELDEALFGMFPDAGWTSDDNKDLLSAMVHMCQYFDLSMVPTRSGNIGVQTSAPLDDYGVLDVGMMMTYPRSSKATVYNVVSVAYKDGNTTKYHIVDMRTDPAQAKSALVVNNPLVVTLDKAKEITNRLISRIYRMQTETQARADPTMDMGDIIGLVGKWTPDAPTNGRAIYIETTYDGGLTSTIRAVR